MKYLKKFIPHIVAIGLFIFMIWVMSHIPCTRYKDYVASSFRGSVTKKFVDHSEHSDPIIYIKTDTGIHVLNFSSDTILYNALRIGDTIIKAKGDLYMHITNDKRQLKAIMQFDCDSAAK